MCEYKIKTQQPNFCKEFGCLNTHGNTPESNIDPNGLSPFGASEYELRQRSRATTDGGGGEGATRASGNGWLGVPGGDPEGFFRFGQSDWAGAFTQRTEARIAQQNLYASFNQILGDAGYDYRISSNGQWQGGGASTQSGYTPEEANAMGAVKDAGGRFYQWVQTDPNDLGSLQKQYLVMNAGIAPQSNDNNVSNSNGGFLGNNWKDIAFMANDLTQAVTKSSLTAALRMGRPTSIIHVLGRGIPISTKIASGASAVGKFAAKSAPWVAAGAIAVDIAANKQINAGHVYQGVVTGLSLIPGAGLIVGGGALALEGISYFFTGKSVSDNINASLNGGIIYKW